MSLAVETFHGISTSLSSLDGQWGHEEAAGLQTEARDLSLLSSFTKQQAQQRICEWFTSWKPWQQKMLLCGMTNRCTVSQLQLLATSLEPVFHRDFMTQTRRRYPSTPLKRNRHQKKNLNKKDIPQITVQADRGSEDLVQSENIDDHMLKKLNKFAQNLVDIIISEAYENVTAADAPPPGYHQNRRDTKVRLMEDLNLKDTLQQMVDSREAADDDQQSDPDCTFGEQSGITDKHREARHQNRTSTKAGDTEAAQSAGTDAEDAGKELPHNSTVVGSASFVKHKLEKITEEGGEGVEKSAENRDEGQTTQQSSEDEDVTVLPGVTMTTESAEDEDVTVLPGVTMTTESVKDEDVTVLPGVTLVAHGSQDVATQTQTPTPVRQILTPAPVSDADPAETAVSATSRPLPVSHDRTSASSTNSSTSQSKVHQQHKKPEIFTVLRQPVQSSGQPERTEKAHKMSQQEYLHSGPRVSLRGQRSEGPEVRGEERSLDSRLSLSTRNSAAPLRIAHRHRNSLSSVDVKSADFFNRQRLQRLGHVQTVSKDCGTSRSLTFENLAPAQQMYKHQKWWSNETGQGRTYYRPHRGLLKKQFKVQLDQVWKWLEDWKAHERLIMLSTIVKQCQVPLINHLAQCLVQRLKEKVDIDWLPDALLLHIFSFLSPRQRRVAAQVCLRWKYLCCSEEFWTNQRQNSGQQGAFEHLINFDENKVYSTHFMTLPFVSLDLDPTSQDMKSNTSGSQERTPGDTSESTVDDDRADFGYSRDSTATSTPRSFLPRIPLNVSPRIPKEHEEGASTDEKPDDLVLPPIKSQETEESPPWSKSSNRQKEFPQVNLHEAEGAGADSPSMELLNLPEESAVQIIPETSRSRATHRKRQKKAENEEEDMAFDVRPEMQQAKDILRGPHDAQQNLLSLDGEEMKERLKQAGAAKAVKRVRKLQGHMDAVLCVQFDARRLISGSMDRTVRIWDVRSGRSVHKLYGHKGGVTCLQFLENTLVTGSWDMSVMVWDLINFARVGMLTGHRGSVSCLSFTQDYLVTGSHDKTVRVWCMRTLLPVCIIHGHQNHVTCLHFDGLHVTSGSSDKTIRMTNIMTGQCVRIFTGSVEAISRIHVQGGLVVSASTAGHVHFWDRESGVLEAGIQAHESPIQGIQFWGGHFFTASSDNSIKEWDIATMTCIRSLHGHKGPVRDFKVSSRRFVSCSDDGHIRIWDLFVPTIQLDKGDNVIETRLINQGDAWSK